MQSLGMRGYRKYNFLVSGTLENVIFCFGIRWRFHFVMGVNCLVLGSNYGYVRYGGQISAIFVKGG